MPPRDVERVHRAGPWPSRKHGSTCSTTPHTGWVDHPVSWSSSFLLQSGVQQKASHRVVGSALCHAAGKSSVVAPVGAAAGGALPVPQERVPQALGAEPAGPHPSLDA
eukprot:4191154-Amphidinium_carterae.1